MKKIKYIIFIMISLSACCNTQSDMPIKDVNPEVVSYPLGLRDVYEEEYPIPCQFESEEITYNLRMKRDTFWKELGSQLDYLTVQVISVLGDCFEFNKFVEGQVVNAVMTDLDNDGVQELILTITSIGSGGFSDALVYSMCDDGAVRLIPFKEYDIENFIPSPAWGGNYSSAWRIYDNKLCKYFPVYNESDGNCCPSNGAGRMEYSVQKKNEKKSFVVDRYTYFPNIK